MGPVSRRELVARLRALGFDGPYSGGRHSFMGKDSFKIRASNPHRGGEVSVGLLREILRQAGVTPEEWDSTG